MGFYEEHIQMVASRVAERISKGNSDKNIFDYLVYCGWTIPEAQAITRLARRYLEGANGKPNNV